MVVSGIYEIRNIKTGDCYIGSSLKIKERKRRHFKDLRKGVHHSIILQRAFNKYKNNSFEFNIVEEVTEPNLLIIREQYWLDKIQPKYNICKIANSALGIKHSLEACEKKRKYALDNNIKPPIVNKKIVHMIDMKLLSCVKTFNSITDACIYLGKTNAFVSTITDCCTNKRFSAFGYRWVYSIEDIPKLKKLKRRIAWNKGLKIDNKRSKVVHQFTSENIYIKTFSSVKDAEEIYGKGISNNALGRSITSHGYKWSYRKTLDNENKT